MSARKPEVRLTSRARRDVNNILLYTERTWGEEQSAAYASAITRVLDVLRDHSQFGRQHDDLFPGCRSVQVQQHVVYYHQPQTDLIEVIRILHRRQDASTLIGDSYASAPDEA